MRDRIDPLLDYAEALSGPVPDYLNRIERRTHLTTVAPQMLSGRLQGRVLALLSKLQRPRRVLEIGTFTGYSALCLAEGLAADGYLHTIEGNPEHAHWAAENFFGSPFNERIELHIGDARTILPTLREPWDLVFLDGDKRGYPDYLEYCAEHLEPGGLLLADNVLWDGRVGRGKDEHPDVRALQNYNELLRQSRLFEVVVLPFRDGLSVARRL